MLPHAVAKIRCARHQLRTVIGIAEIAPNVNIGRHTHRGPESGCVLEGDMMLLVEGPSPLALTTGERGAKTIATVVVEKDKPLATPAP